MKESLERWRNALEDQGMSISRKTKYLHVGGEENVVEAKMLGKRVPRVKEFSYLGSTVQANGGNELEMAKRIVAGWNSLRNVPLSVKGKLHRVAVWTSNVVKHRDPGSDAGDSNEVGSC